MSRTIYATNLVEKSPLCSLQSVDLRDWEKSKEVNIVKLFSYFAVLLKLAASSHWPMLKVCVSFRVVLS